MILATDVAYSDTLAFAAGVLFQEWSDADPQRTIVARIDQVQAYVPGQFYKREMPCILELLTRLNKLPDIIVIDGFVHLGRERRPGLGQRLYDELKGEVPVIGVAKKLFHGTPGGAELYRGNSRSALYVTAVGVNEDAAKDCIAEMHGLYRIPTLLKLVDHTCRSALKENRTRASNTSRDIMSS